MRILLTGASGFLGSALVRQWSNCGHELSLLARPSSSFDELHALTANIHILQSFTPSDISLVVQKVSPEIIVHAACSYGHKKQTELNMLEANHYLGAMLLQAALSADLRESKPVTFINVGTGLNAEVSLYALSKSQFSAWGAMLAQESSNRIRFIDLRLQQMYGPNGDKARFTSYVIESCRRNEPYLALTGGKQLRDFIHIDDVVRAFEYIIKEQYNFEVSEVIDVGSGSAVTVRYFAELVKNLANSSTKLDFGAIPYRPNEPMLCVADISRLRSLGWSPEVSLADGVESVLRHNSSIAA